MSDFRDHLKENLEDAVFKKEWDALQPEHEIIKMIIDARREKGLTQKQLAELSGLRQSNISRIETGKVTPDIATLQAIARGLDKELKIEFL